MARPLPLLIAFWALGTAVVFTAAFLEFAKGREAAREERFALIEARALDQRERLLDLGFARIDLRTPEEVAVRPSEGAV